ncbi:hypothetical protein ANN_21266 [Periplaneta americana]|uniref:Uncharacterized protein n=1 Tax=Periplaneta americana TaxID=6978 RepID=A0ABQ8SEV1_PERAM|nr:hypothetical protein ANN_21266 [Periplaneta americana]
MPAITAGGIIVLTTRYLHSGWMIVHLCFGISQKSELVNTIGEVVSSLWEFRIWCPYAEACYTYRSQAAIHTTGLTYQTNMSKYTLNTVPEGCGLDLRSKQVVPEPSLVTSRGMGKIKIQSSDVNYYGFENSVLLQSISYTSEYGCCKRRSDYVFRGKKETENTFTIPFGSSARVYTGTQTKHSERITCRCGQGLSSSTRTPRQVKRNDMCFPASSLSLPGIAKLYFVKQRLNFNLNELNCRLQGRDQNIVDMYDAFKTCEWRSKLFGTEPYTKQVLSCIGVGCTRDGIAYPLHISASADDHCYRTSPTTVKRTVLIPFTSCIQYKQKTLYASTFLNSTFAVRTLETDLVRKELRLPSHYPLQRGEQKRVGDTGMRRMQMDDSNMCENMIQY